MSSKTTVDLKNGLAIIQNLVRAGLTFTVVGQGEKLRIETEDATASRMIKSWVRAEEEIETVTPAVASARLRKLAKKLEANEIIGVSANYDGVLLVSKVQARAATPVTE